MPPHPCVRSNNGAGADVTWVKREGEGDNPCGNQGAIYRRKIGAVKGQNLQGCHHMVRQIFTQIYHKWVAMAAGAARLQADQCRSLCYDKHHRWMVTVVMTLLIDSHVS
jgi:hypothetical protein